jgi:hypothetical protein
MKAVLSPVVGAAAETPAVLAATASGLFVKYAILESNVPYSVTVDCACAAEAKAPNAARANSDFFIRKSPCDLKKHTLKTTSPNLEE